MGEYLAQYQNRSDMQLLVLFIEEGCYAAEASVGERCVIQEIIQTNCLQTWCGQKVGIRIQSIVIGNLPRENLLDVGRASHCACSIGVW